MAIYRFLINDVLWACQWSDYAHLQYQPSYGTKKHVYQVSACTDGRIDGRIDSYPDFNSSIYLDHLYIYITL